MCVCVCAINPFIYRMLQRAHRKKTVDINLNINCTDCTGRGALTIAIDAEHLEMVELLVIMSVETKDALLQAINAEFVEAVELLLEVGGSFFLSFVVVVFFLFISLGFCNRVRYFKTAFHLSMRFTSKQKTAIPFCVCVVRCEKQHEELIHKEGEPYVSTWMIQFSMFLFMVMMIINNKFSALHMHILFCPSLTNL